MQVPLDPRVEELSQLPYTISYVVRKMQQIDNFNELPKEKRPPTDMIWDGTSDELDEWLDRVLGGPKKPQHEVELLIDDIEG